MWVYVHINVKIKSTIRFLLFFFYIYTLVGGLLYNKQLKRLEVLIRLLRFPELLTCSEKYSINNNNIVPFLRFLTWIQINKGMICKSHPEQSCLRWPPCWSRIQPRRWSPADCTARRCWSGNIPCDDEDQTLHVAWKIYLCIVIGKSIKNVQNIYRFF